MKRKDKKYELGQLEHEKRLRLFLRKKPDYFYSFAGTGVFLSWCKIKEINQKEMELLIILSYHKFFLQADLKYFGINRRLGKARFDKLVEAGYIQKVSVPGAHAARFRMCYVLTSFGEDLEKDYEKYFDMYWRRYTKIRNGKSIDFETTAWLKNKKKKELEKWNVPKMKN